MDKTVAPKHHKVIEKTASTFHCTASGMSEKVPWVQGLSTLDKNDPVKIEMQIYHVSQKLKDIVDCNCCAELNNLSPKLSDFEILITPTEGISKRVQCIPNSFDIGQPYK